MLTLALLPEGVLLVTLLLLLIYDLSMALAHHNLTFASVDLPALTVVSQETSARRCTEFSK